MTADEYEQRRPQLLQALAEGQQAPRAGSSNEPEEGKWLRELRNRLANMTPEEYERQRGSILLELNQRRFGRGEGNQ